MIVITSAHSFASSVRIFRLSDSFFLTVHRLPSWPNRAPPSSRAHNLLVLSIFSRQIPNQHQHHAAQEGSPRQLWRKGRRQEEYAPDFLSFPCSRCALTTKSLSTMLPVFMFSFTAFDPIVSLCSLAIISSAPHIPMINAVKAKENKAKANPALAGMNGRGPG